MDACMLVGFFFYPKCIRLFSRIRVCVHQYLNRLCSQHKVFVGVDVDKRECVCVCVCVWVGVCVCVCE